jgi:hypothetical protein
MVRQRTEPAFCLRDDFLPVGCDEAELIQTID